MKALVEMHLVRAMHRERVDNGRSRRAAARAARLEEVVIRQAADSDARRLERLAELDSTVPLHGPALVAEVDGMLVAAMPLNGGRALADPFLPTAPVVKMLELRAAQLRAVG